MQQFPISEERSQHIEWQMTTQILGIFKTAITESGMRHADIAREMEWSEAKLHAMLNGMSEWTLRDMGEMSFVLGIEIDLQFVDPEDETQEDAV